MSCGEEGCFVATVYLHRDDLEDIGYDSSVVTDEVMEKLAYQMANAFRDFGYYIGLDTLADTFGIPKKEVQYG
jgi:hypothetical protein